MAGDFEIDSHQIVESIDLLLSDLVPQSPLHVRNFDKINNSSTEKKFQFFNILLVAERYKVLKHVSAAFTPAQFPNTDIH